MNTTRHFHFGLAYLALTGFSGMPMSIPAGYSAPLRRPNQRQRRRADRRRYPHGWTR